MTRAKQRALRAALVATMGVTTASVGAGCDTLLDSDPCNGTVFIYRDADGCACVTRGDMWEDKWFEPGVCIAGRAVPGPFVPPAMA